jgi:anti-sigma factor RsiW
MTHDRDAHLTDELAQGLLDRQLDPACCAEVEAHLACCAGCGALVESYRVLGESLDRLDPGEPPPDFTAAVMQRIDDVERARARERRLAFGIVAGTLVAAAAVRVVAGAGSLASAVGAWAETVGHSAQAFRIGRGLLPGVLSAVRLPLLLAAAACALPLLAMLARLMPAPRTETT